MDRITLFVAVAIFVALALMTLLTGHSRLHKPKVVETEKDAIYQGLEQVAGAILVVGSMAVIIGTLLAGIALVKGLM